MWLKLSAIEFTHSFPLPFEYDVILFDVLAKDCGPLASPLNGTRLGNQTTYPHVMAFFCDDGFHLKGSERRRCTADGTWGGMETICEGNTSLEGAGALVS